MTTATTVDVNVPRFNHAVVAALTGTAFVFRIEWLITLVAAVLIVSRVGGPRLAPLTRLYVQVIRPRLRSAGPTEFESAAPPRFAQLLGAIFLSLATVAFAVGSPGVGWGLSLIVTTLAALAATTRICVGCLIYERALT